MRSDLAERRCRRAAMIALSPMRIATHLTVGESARAAQGQVDSILARERVLRGLQRSDAVVTQTARPAENDDVAVREHEPLRPLLALQAAEQEHGRHAER